MDQSAGDLHTHDLAWAALLATGDRAALDRYEAEIVPMIAAHLRRRGASEDAIADLQQTLRTRLFVGDGRGPSIVSYRGRGALRSWVLVSALREAARVQQRSAREPAFEDDALLALADRGDIVAPDPDKDRYRDVFRAAFRAALGELTPRDRNLLRMHVIDELSIDQIGLVQGVHRATAARWIERARERIAQAVRRQVMRSLGTDPFEADDLLRWLHSRIELSLSGLASST